jgi:hypothetical protein
MSSNARYRIGLILVACAAAGAAVWTLNSKPRHSVIRPGSAAFSVADDGIRRITYRTGAMTLTARRAAAGGFDVEVRYGDGREAQRCTSSPDLAGMLPGLAEITAKRELTPEQAAAEFPVPVGVLELEDQIAAEPIPPFTVRGSSARSSIALVYGDTAFEAALPPETFARLESGCSALGGK